jgi:hypothetical protein
MKILNITRVATATGIAGALAVAAIAYASSNKTPSAPTSVASVTDPATLPKFAHVQVINATPEQIAVLGKESSQRALSQRAYVDPATRQLRAALPEELAAEAAAAKSAPVVADAVVTRLANGAKRATVDESYMSYATATVQADGTVKQDCVTGQPNERAALTVASASQGVDRHEK